MTMAFIAKTKAIWKKATWTIFLIKNNYCATYVCLVHDNSNGFI